MTNKSGLAITSLVLALIGLLLPGLFNLIAMLLALVLGIWALKKIKEEALTGKGLAYAGIIIAGIVIIGNLGILFTSASLGVLKPPAVPKCFVPSLDCIENTYIADEGIKIAVLNGVGKELTDVSLRIDGKDCNANSNTIAKLPNGQRGTFTIPCTLTKGTFQGSISTTYTADSLKQEKKEGVLVLKVY